MKHVSPHWSKDFLMKRVGDISQIAGIKRYEFVEGKAKGVEAADIRTGSGLAFTVLPGRGMDIAWAEYRGVPISYISKTAVVSPAYYEPHGINWLRGFFGGLLTTCGLSNVGWPCSEDDPVFGQQCYGLHGRISNTAAENVCVREQWLENSLVFSISGRLRESMVHRENLLLHREMTTKLGSNKLVIHDTVENAGFVSQPLMLLYHCNFGYPLLDHGSVLVCNCKRTEAASETAPAGIGAYNTFDLPTPGYEEQVYFHEMNTNGESETWAVLLNEELELAVYLKYRKDQLPKFTEWKMLAESEYVLGLEPGNCVPTGRVKQRETGDLKWLEPGENRQFGVEIGVLDGKAEIQQVTSIVDSLNSKR
jgi:hypothetical protein